MSSYRRCCVPGCIYGAVIPQVRHRFPNPEKYRERFRAWIQAIGGDILTLDNDHIYKNRRVCRSHFEDRYLCRNNKISFNSLPTLNMPEPILHASSTVTEEEETKNESQNPDRRTHILDTSGDPDTSIKDNGAPTFQQQNGGDLISKKKVNPLSKHTERLNIDDVLLPRYDPDGKIGVREWCKHISTVISKYDFSDYDICMKVTSLLQGRAKLWAISLPVNTISWDELRRKIITKFKPEHHYCRDVLEFKEHNYDPSKNIAKFISKSWGLWRRLTKNKLDDSDAVEAVIGTISDERLRIELMNARAISVPELISFASSIRVKRTKHRTQNVVPTKRLKHAVQYRNISYCHLCQKSGHSYTNCLFKEKQMT